MTITVNGTPHDLPDNTTVESLIEILGLTEAVCAAEVNKNLVPRSDRSTVMLKPGDSVEIVTLVGGG